MEDLVHLSLVDIMATLVPEYGHNQARYNFLSNLLRHALQRYADIPERDDEVLLWAVFVGYATVLNDSDIQGLTLLVFERMVLRKWNEICLMLCRYAWIGVFKISLG
jgi:hypothetical protein